MGLVDKQAAFAQAVALLIQKADELGYQVTFGDGYRDDRVTYGSEHSLHRQRLAHDFNVFRDGVYLTDGSQYEDLGEFWESIPGAAWGGRFKDGNHFSFAHGGYK
jgi:hypothetical protein